jgi:hypothetical protein
MNYDILINNQFWKTLTYPDPTPAQTILAIITQAQHSGELNAFAVPDGSFDFEIRSYS